jgi:hypothetical protein
MEARAVRATRHDEKGSLLIALAVLMVLAIIVVAMLSLGFTSFREVTSTQDQRTRVYTSDAALNGAIEAARQDFNIKAATIQNSGSWDFCASTPVFRTTLNSVTSSAACTVDGVSGADVGPPTPAAVRTIGGGIVVDGDGTFRFGGDVQASTTVEVRKGKGKLVMTSGTLSSVGDCKGKGTINGTMATAQPPPPNCHTLMTPPADPAVADPSGWAASAGGPPAVPVVPACSGGVGATITMSPGTYSSATILTNLMNGKTAACKSKIFNFTPGLYYFNFTNAGTHEWKVDDATAAVVGGELASAVYRPKTPGACTRNTPLKGVQFIFGGDSRLSVNKGTFELCPYFANAFTSQRIAIYGYAADKNGFKKTTGTLLKSGDRAVVSIHGSIYAPNSALDLKTKRLSTPLVDRGVFVRSLKVQGSTYGGQGVLVPSAVDPSATMTITTKNGAVTTAVAQVSFTKHGTDPAQVTVISWVVNR